MLTREFRDARQKRRVAGGLVEKGEIGEGRALDNELVEGVE